MRSMKIAARVVWTITFAKRNILFIGWGRISNPDSERKANTTAPCAGCSVQPVVHPAAERRGGNEVGLEGNPRLFTPSRSEGVNAPHEPRRDSGVALDGVVGSLDGDK